MAVISRYLLREFFGILVPIILAFVALYLIIDFFDRLDFLLRYEAQPMAALRYFAFKVPLILTQIIPPAVIAALLIALGTLARRNEVTALRASGVSLAQIASPLLVAALLLSLAVLAWNETVVPYSTRLHEQVDVVEIRKHTLRGILSDRQIWYHGREGFYNIDHVDAKRGTLFGLTIYRTDHSSFGLRSVVQVKEAQWTGRGWRTVGAVERRTGSDGELTSHPLAADRIVISESMDDFLEVHREPEELSYRELRSWIRDLGRKGIDASEYLVDLHLKLAVPFAALVLACVGIPLAGRLQLHPSLAATLGTGIVLGFGYWVILALTRSLGQSGALPATLAAWAANGIYLLLGALLFLRSE
jgi:lipopolysaccharide export system permease protein